MAGWKIKRHELMRRITIDNNCYGNSGFYFTDFVKELWPYSPAYHTPYRLDIHKDHQTNFVGVASRFLFPPLPLADKHNWDCCHVINWPGDIYDSIEAALFKITDVEAFEASHPLQPSTSKILIRRDVALSAAKIFQQRNIGLPFPDAVKEVNVHLAQNGYQPYSSNQCRRIFKDLKFPPGKTGPNTSK